jgi:probable HAF family extracellular repeat protein
MNSATPSLPRLRAFARPLALALACLAASSPAASAPQYSARELVGPDGHAMWPFGISPTGVVVGRNFARSPDVEGRWSEALPPGGAILRFQPLGNSASNAYGINAAGTIVGEMWVASVQSTHPFVRYADGTTLDLFAGVTHTTYGQATAVNATGDVVGYQQPQGFNYTAFLWHDGHLTDLGSLGGGVSYATAINDAGVVVGYSWGSKNAARAFRYQDGTMVALGILPDVVYSAQANAVAPDGTAVGVNELNDGTSRSVPCLWRPRSTRAEELPTLPGGGRTAAPYGINAAHDIVGTARNKKGSMHAALWHDGAVYDLNALVADLPVDVVLKSAIAINDDGLVVVDGIDATRTRRHFVLMPMDGN